MSVEAGRQVALILIALVMGAVSNSCCGQDPAPTNSHFDHLLFIAAKQEGGRRTPELVLQQIPSRTPNSEELEAAHRQSHVAPRLGMGRPVGVYGGHLIAQISGHLEAINLKTGNQFNLMKFVAQAVLVDDRVFALGPRGMLVTELNLETLETTRLRSMNAHRNAHTCLALSPEAHLLATTSCPPETPQQPHSLFGIEIYDRRVNPPKMRRLEHNFGGRLVLTGGGDHLVGPILAWWDEDTLLVVSPDLLPADEDAGVVGIGDQRPLFLRVLDVNTGDLVTVCALPAAQLKMFHDPHFWHQPDGQLRLKISALGDFRIDLKQRKLIKEEMLTDQYALRGDPQAPALYFGETELADRVGPTRVSVSPDGRQVAWLPPDEVRQGVITTEPMTLRVHSPERGVIELASSIGFFGDREQLEITLPAPSPNSMLLWVTAEQLQPSGALAERE